MHAPPPFWSWTQQLLAHSLLWEHAAVHALSGAPTQMSPSESTWQQSAFWVHGVPTPPLHTPQKSDGAQVRRFAESVLQQPL